jgi:hypothetical protein
MTDAPRPKPEPGPHHLVAELFRLLPPAEAQWTLQERELWLKAAAASFDLVYGYVGDFAIGGRSPPGGIP